MAHNYVVTAQKPTAVSSCLTGNFTSPTDLNLLVAKVTNLEMYLVTPEGLLPMKEIGLYGRVAKMKQFRPPNENKDLVFILTSRYDAMILEWKIGEDKSMEVVTRAYGNISTTVGKLSENGVLAMIDPQAKLIGLRIYDGMLNLIILDKDSTELKSVLVNLQELNVYDIEFLHGVANPTLILIHQDLNGRHVKTYEICMQSKQLGKSIWKQDNVETEASILIPVPSPLGGILVIGQESIVYHDGQSYVAVAPPQIKSTPINCYCRVDSLGHRYLLGDIAGRLFMLLLELQERTYDGTMAVKDLKVELLGEIPIPECMTYLDNGVVFVGSRLGDSALVRLTSTRDDNSQYVQLMQSFTSLSPITDMCLVDLEKQGQNQLITCSGAFKMGSLRIIRNGIGVGEQATIELPGIKGLWPVMLNSTTHHDILLLAFVGQTRVLALNGEEVEETEIPGFVSDKQTLFCGNVCHDQIIQVTEEGIRLISRSAPKLSASRALRVSLVACGTERLVSAAGPRLLTTAIRNGDLETIAEREMDHEVSCITVSPYEDWDLAAVGLWTDISVTVLRLSTLEPLYTEKLPGEIIPRSILICELDGVSYLLVALGDGSMSYFSLHRRTGVLSNKKIVVLGTLPTLLSTFRTLSTTNVFACCDRPKVIYSSNQKLVFSNVNIKEVTHMCSLNAQAYPNSLALATDSTITIGTIDEIQKLHIRTVPLGETPRRIAYQQSTSTFGVLTMRVDKIEVTETGSQSVPARPSASTAAVGSSGAAPPPPPPPPPPPAAELESYHLLVMDHHTFEVLHAHQFHATEVALSLLSCRLGKDPVEYFVVGTGFVNPEEAEPKKGRIILFQWSENRLTKVGDKEIRGACYSLCEFNGALIAGVNSTVRLFEWTEDKELRLDCSYFNNIIALYLKVKGDFILVGDIMRSMTVLQYKQMEGSFEEIARDYSPQWMMAVEILDDDNFLGAENNANLFVCQRNSAATCDEDRQFLSTVGTFQLGDTVNVVRRGLLVAQHAAADVAPPPPPPALAATTAGGLFLIVQLQPEMFEFLYKLQERLTQTIKSVGKICHASWRNQNCDKDRPEAEGFIDGDLVESFLDLNRDLQQKTIEKLQVPESISKRDLEVDDVIKILEDLSRLH